MPVVAMPPKKPEKPADPCTYRSIKVDDALLPHIGAAARLSGKLIQDWASDILNAAAAKELNRPPVVRRPPPPRKKSGPKPKP